MNPRRVATLLRERARVAREAAELDEQLADAYEGEAANDAEPPPVRRPRRKPVPLVKPTGAVKPTDIDMARADALLKRHYGR